MKIKAMAASIVFVLLLVQPVKGEPYQGHIYNSYGEIVSAPNAYLPDKVTLGTDLGIGHFVKPADMFRDKNNRIYVLDTGNSRIVLLDKDLKLLKIIKDFTYKGKEEKLKDATGIFVSDEGKIYLADRGNARIVVCDMNGNITGIFGKPKSELISENTVYAPKKIVVNSIGTMFIQSDNINHGLVKIDKNGTFLGFFGSDKIQATKEMLSEMWWRRFSTKEQIAQRTSFQPIEYTNMFINSKDFIYTCTAYTTLEKAQIRKFNPSGINTLPEVGYGDIRPDKANQRLTQAQFLDVTVDDDQFIYAVDKQTGKIFMYSQKSDLLAIFASNGSNPGTFSEPVALETIGDKVLVLDTKKANITVFTPTDYGKYIREGAKLQELGKYEEALKPWTEVQRLNNNFEMAYIGIGRALYLTGDYKGAMENFKLGNNKELYSKAKKDYRTFYLRKHFSLYVSLLLLLSTGTYYGLNNRKNIKKLYSSRFILVGKGRKLNG